MHIMEFDLEDGVFVQTDGLSFVDIRQQGVPTKPGVQLTVKSWQNLLGANEQLVVDMFNILTKRQWVHKWNLNGMS